jgi:hypothetical protein
MKIDHEIWRVWEFPSYPFGLNKATGFNEFVEGLADTFILNRSSWMGKRKTY